jgi:hypothetical protein
MLWYRSGHVIFLLMVNNNAQGNELFRDDVIEKAGRLFPREIRRFEAPHYQMKSGISTVLFALLCAATYQGSEHHPVGKY